MHIHKFIKFMLLTIKVVFRAFVQMFGDNHGVLSRNSKAKNVTTGINARSTIRGYSSAILGELVDDTATSYKPYDQIRLPRLRMYDTDPAVAINHSSPEISIVFESYNLRSHAFTRNDPVLSKIACHFMRSEGYDCGLPVVLFRVFLRWNGQYFVRRSCEIDKLVYMTFINRAKSYGDVVITNTAVSHKESDPICRLWCNSRKGVFVNVASPSSMHLTSSVFGDFAYGRSVNPVFPFQHGAFVSIGISGNYLSSCKTGNDGSLTLNEARSVQYPPYARSRNFVLLCQTSVSTAFSVQLLEFFFLLERKLPTLSEFVYKHFSHNRTSYTVRDQGQIIADNDNCPAFISHANPVYKRIA